MLKELRYETQKAADTWDDAMTALVNARAALYRVAVRNDAERNALLDLIDIQEEQEAYLKDLREGHIRNRKIPG